MKSIVNLDSAVLLGGLATLGIVGVAIVTLTIAVNRSKESSAQLDSALKDYNTSLAASKVKLAAAKKSANFNGDPSDRDPIVAAAKRL